MSEFPPLGGIHYFKHARNESLKSNYKVKMGAALVIGKNIIKGHNKIKTHPIYGYSVHAEIDCLLKSRKYDIIGASLFIYRENRKGEPAMARPCSNCMKALKEAGVHKIYYSTSVFPYFKHERIN